MLDTKEIWRRLLIDYYTDGFCKVYMEGLLERHYDLEGFSCAKVDQWETHLENLVQFSWLLHWWVL